jgi:CobQ-like glutamine amidotransferase family enzyme
MLTIALLFPQLLGTYGDGGNALVLANRARRRGIEAEVLRVDEAAQVPASADLYVLGGGEDGAQSIAGDILRSSTAFRRALDRDAPTLAVCASFQLLGETYAGAGGEPIAGMGVLDCVTRRGPRRVLGDTIVRPRHPDLHAPLLGFENHGGVTALGAGAQPLGTHVDGSGPEGAVQGHLVATYLHGPVLPANPELADLLLSWAVGPLEPLDAPWVAEMRAEREAAARAKAEPTAGRLRRLVRRS